MDTISTTSLIITLVGLILCSAYFSSSETAMMALNRYRLKHLARKKHQGAMQAQTLLKKPEKLIGLILIGNNLVNILASAVATIIGLRLFGDIGIAIATATLTFVILIFAEVTPKTLAALYPEKIAFPSSYVLRGLMRVFYPFVHVINFFSNNLLKLFRVSTTTVSDELTAEELRSVVNDSQHTISNNNRRMLLSILDLGVVTVDDIMIPRAELYSLNINESLEHITKIVVRSPHTRVVVYRDSIDNTIGLLHIRDVLKLLGKKQFSKSSILRAVRKPYFIPESTPLNVQLVKFQKRKERTGFVVDEYGDIQGIVTLEDILEEIVGDFNTLTQAHQHDIQPQQDGSFIIDGSIYLRELNKEMNWKLPIDGPKTLNGLILEYLEDIPKAQTSLRVSGYPMEIVNVSDNMIKSVRVMPQYLQ